MKLATAQQMRKLDATTINDYGIPGIILMENAGAGAVRAMADRFAELAGNRVAIIAGPGNNGGDGFVMARHLYQAGALPEVFLLVDADKYKGDAGTNLQIIEQLPIPIYPCHNSDDLLASAADILASDFVVDAIFGTGLSRNISGHFGQAIGVINQSCAPVIAVDLPSGLDADSGAVLGQNVLADLTVTFGLAKPAHVLEISQQACGDLAIIDISIPPEAIDEANLHIEVTSCHSVARSLPPRPINAHKGTFGHLLILAGANGKNGAAIMGSQGALRSGVGLVSLAAPQCIGPIHTIIPEAMSIPLQHSHNFLSQKDFALINQEISTRQAVAIGPGIGQAAETCELIVKLYTTSKTPMVIDADALNILADSGVIKDPPAARILTPHPGEMARLTGKPIAEIQADRINSARDFATANNIYLVLKGARTIIAAPNGGIAINPTGNPAMAVGGMGDVLCGLIGGLMAQGLSPWQAACTSVYCHGLAGDLLITDQATPGSILASDLALEIPRALTHIFHDL